MGPIDDQLGVGKDPLELAQRSELGVKVSRDLVVSAIGQADDTLLVSNNLHNLQNLLQLSLHHCSKSNVELCPGKTKLQVLATKKMRRHVDYLKHFSPVNLNGTRLDFCDSAEHVGILRSINGNLPNIYERIFSHKKALAAVLYTGVAKQHRANPAAGLRLERLYGAQVLLSGLGSLVLSKFEISVFSKYHKDTIQGVPQNIGHFCFLNFSASKDSRNFVLGIFQQPISYRF